MRQVNFIAIHCSATSQTATVESIQRYWREEMGWKSPGYHVIVKPNGEAVELLPIDKVSNGVAGFNSITINICYIGGIDSKGKAIDNRTSQQKETILRYIQKWHKLFPNAKIQGHRDFSPDKNKNGKIESWEFIKMCPSFSVADWLKEINFYGNT